VTVNEISQDRLQREWALCALAAAAARFVPVPLLDDVVRQRAIRTAVARTWKAHGKAAAPDVVGVLCDDTRGFWHGMAVSAARLPATLVLYPVRKAVRVVTSVRGVGRDLAEVLLLARAVDRCLRAGWFATSDEHELLRQAALVRDAHEQVVGTADLRVVEHAFRTALRQVGGLRTQTADFARRAFGKDTADPVTDGRAFEAAGDGVELGAARLRAALARPDVESAVEGLDRRFDAVLGPPSA
jgi:hypothetical protein